MKKLIGYLMLMGFMPGAAAQQVHWGGVVNTTYNDYIYDLQVDHQFNLIICGQFSGTVDFDPGAGIANLTTASSSDGNIFLAKYDSAGNFLWAHGFGTGFLNDEGNRLAVDTAGNIFITGMFGSTIDFDPDPGNTASISSWGSGRSRFLAKYDAAGNFIAVKQVGNAVGNLPSSQDGQSGLGCDRDGHVYMSGFYGTSLTLGPGTTLSLSGLSDNYFAKYDGQLNLKWGHRLGSNSTEYSQGMFVHETGKVIVLGSFRNTVDFDPGPGTYNLTQTSSTQDGYFGCYDSAGQFLFVRQLEAGTSATPIATLIDENMNILVAGSCAGTMDADPGTGVSVVGAGFNDQAFVAAYDSTGNYRWAFAYGDVNAFNAIRYIGVDTADHIYAAGNYNPMVDVDPGPGTAVFGNKYGSYVSRFDTSGTFLTSFFLQEVKMRLKEDDVFLAGGFYGLVDFDPGPQNYPMQSDTLNASWYLLRLHLCESYALIPDSIIIPPVCAGDTVTLTATGGGPLYQWELPAGFTAVGPVNDSILVAAVDQNASSGTVLAGSLGGCLNSPLAVAEILVNQPLVPVIVTSVSGDTLLTQQPAVFYQWYYNNTLLSGANDSIYVPPTGGWYMVMTIDSNGCEAFSDSVQVVINSLDATHSGEAYIFPNPAAHDITIQFPSAGAAREIVLADITGKVIRTLTTGSNRVRISLEFLDRGFYTVIIRDAGGQASYRVIRM